MQRVIEYAQTDALNQSLIKAIRKGIGLYKYEKAKDSTAFLYGRVVETLLLDEPEFINMFYVDNNFDKRPTKKIMDIIDKLSVTSTIEEQMPNLISIIEQEGYYKTWGIDARVSDVISKGGDYFRTRQQQGARLTVSKEEYDRSLEIVQSLRSHPHTKWYFERREGFEYFTQFPIYWEIYGVKCKGLLDYIIIDHNEKKIYIIDIKTIGASTILFKESFERFEYDIQAAWYTRGLLAQEEIGFTKLSGYKIQPFLFIVESTKHVGACPLVYIFKDTIKAWQDKCMDGIYRYKWHEEHGWDYDKEVMETNGHLIIDYGSSESIPVR